MSPYSDSTRWEAIKVESIYRVSADKTGLEIARLAYSTGKMRENDEGTL